MILYAVGYLNYHDEPVLYRLKGDISHRSYHDDSVLYRLKGDISHLSIIIIMEMCKAPTLRLKAMNKHCITHVMYSEKEITLTMMILYCIG